MSLAHESQSPSPLTTLLLNCLDALPSSAQPLFPKTDTVIPSADGEHVPTQTPAHAPCNRVDVDSCRFPLP
jgi:hypothetical protein